MTDTRRLGHAQRRRLGAPSNVYADTLRPPTHGPGDTVKAPGRYGAQTVVDVMPSVTRPDTNNDGHAYAVQGGKGGRVTIHLSGELKPFQMGQGELD
jgi:hypothetical protein